MAGAPLTNFLSFMGAIHWNPGFPETSHWETGQARMEVPFWEDPDAHRRNSPIHAVHEMETPLLMAFGDDDGTVIDPGHLVGWVGDHEVRSPFPGELMGLLTERLVERLHAEGFKPCWHQRVPPNDGGLALGQAAAAAWTWTTCSPSRRPPYSQMH